MGLHEVSAILWRERNLLELLLFKLEEEQLVLASGRSRWLAHATREVEAVLDRIKDAELARSMEVDAAAPQLLLRPGASLRELAESAPPPWGTMFEDHRQAFLELTEEIVAVANANKELLARGAQAVRDTLSTISDRRPDDGYGFSDASPRRPLVLDEAL
jgi:hypothetical protein